MTAKKKKEATFAEDVAEVLKLIPVSREEKGKLADKIGKLHEKHSK